MTIIQHLFDFCQLGRTAGAPAATQSTLIILFVVVPEFGRKPQERRPKLIRGRCQQSLGLDAGFDRGVQPDEVQRDMAHQCEVVGDMARPGAGVVITKLHIKAQVLPVLDFPVAAYGTHEFLGVRGQAADVVAAFNARLVADTARAFDQGEALQVAPLIALVKPVAGVEGTAAAPFFPVVSRVVALPARGGLQRSANARLSQQDRVSSFGWLSFTHST
jgi:hypothetical protein